MTLHLKKQVRCLLPGIIILMIIGGVAYMKNYLHVPVLTPFEVANHPTYEEEADFLDAITKQESFASLSVVTTTSQPQQLLQQQPVVSKPRIVRDSFNIYVERLSRKYKVLTHYLSSQYDTHQINTAESLSELQCMALNLYFEARGESKAGQQAVAHVVLNRANHAGFPGSVCGVVKQGGEGRRYHCQFTWWCDGLSDKPRNKRSWRQSVILAAEVLNKLTSDPTNGALWYHADYVSPYWKGSMQKGPKIGKHIFYSSKRSNARRRNS